jgi:hypothetical protein
MIQPDYSRQICFTRRTPPSQDLIAPTLLKVLFLVEPVCHDSPDVRLEGAYAFPSVQSSMLVSLSGISYGCTGTFEELLLILSHKGEFMSTSVSESISLLFMNILSMLWLAKSSLPCGNVGHK